MRALHVGRDRRRRARSDRVHRLDPWASSKSPTAWTPPARRRRRRRSASRTTSHSTRCRSRSEADGLGLISFIDPKGLFPRSPTARTSPARTATVTAVDTEQLPERQLGDDRRRRSRPDQLRSVLAPQGRALLEPRLLRRSPLRHVDSDFDVGDWSSITTGSDGLGLISYHDRDNGTLKVAHCSNVACSSATTATIDIGRHRRVHVDHDRLRRARPDQLRGPSDACRAAQGRPLLEHRLLGGDDDDGRS